jgi:Tol biopolymer transport system component
MLGYCFGRNPPPPNNTEINVINMEGGQRQKIVEGSGYFPFPTWSPDGSCLSCRSLSENREMQVVDVQTGGGISLSLLARKERLLDNPGHSGSR